MKREPFATAAGLKWRRYRALALLAAGLALDVETGARGDRQFAQMLAARLAGGDTGLTWRIDDMAARGSMVATLDRQRVEELVGGVPPERRSLALRSSTEVDAADAWLFFATEEDSTVLRKDGWSFWVSARAPELNLPTHRPFLIGYFAGTAAEEAATQLGEDEDLPGPFGVRALSRTTPRCAIQILCDRDLERAIERAAVASAAIDGSSCHLCVVLLKEGFPERSRTREFLRLRDALSSAGLIVGKGDADDALGLTRTLVRELAEGKALWQQRFKTQAGPAMLMCDERMALYGLSTWTLVLSEEEELAGEAAARSRAAVRSREDEEEAPSGEAAAADGTPAEAPGEAKPFPFLPSGAELKRDAKESSGQGRTGGGLLRIRSGPRRGQGGAAPLRPRRGRADDAFGKVEGAPPESAAGAGWIPPSSNVVADGGGRKIDETPGKASSGGRGAKAAIAGALQALGRRSIEPPPPETPEPESPVPAAAPPSPAPATPATGIRDATIVIDGADGEQTLTATDGGGTAIFRMSDDVVEALLTAFDAAMSDIARDPAKYDGVHAPGTNDVLRVLAQKGGSLRSALEQSGGLPPGVTHVRLVSASPGAAFPIEYLYALEPPDDDARLCDKAEEGLRAEGSEIVDGWCPGCAPMARTAQGQSRTLCPLAFWGARCAIERSGLAAESEDDGGGYGIAPKPRRTSEDVLHPLRCAVVGATDRVERADVEAMMETIGASVGTMLEAEDWSDWVYDIGREPTPTMLALVARLKKDVRSGAPQLEIGYGSTLDLDALRLAHVRPSEDAPPPLALLLGAETGLADVGFASFATSFRSMGAIVVSSIASVHAHHAGLVAGELLGAIARARQPVPLAELMPDVRRRLLADCTPAVLSLVALGDAGWRVDATA